MNTWDTNLQADDHPFPPPSSSSQQWKRSTGKWKSFPVADQSPRQLGRAICRPREGASTRSGPSLGLQPSTQGQGKELRQSSRFSP